MSPEAIFFLVVLPLSIALCWCLCRLLLILLGRWNPYGPLHLRDPLLKRRTDDE